jgi:hypothetical protein
MFFYILFYYSQRYLGTKKEFQKCLKESKVNQNADFIERAKHPCVSAWTVIRREGATAKSSTSTNFSAEVLNNFFVQSV